MNGMEAGWYRDPAPANPAWPTTVRYWDGTQWTAQVRPAKKRERLAWRSEIAAQQREYAAAVAGQAALPGGYPGQPGVALDVRRDATPDGEPLAGWWPRVGASVIDGILTTAIGIVFGWRFLTRIGSAYSEFMTQAVRAAEAGQQPPPVETLVGSVIPAMLALAAILWGVKLVYGVGFLKAFQATPGKLLLGLEVRLRERPGPLSWGTVLLRWFTQNLGGALQLVPVVGLLGSVYSLLDGLWPLWDGKRQALHDKAARTNVVRRRD
jgi:uncharacterized RDD family membrane protein YckC